MNLYSLRQLITYLSKIRCETKQWEWVSVGERERDEKRRGEVKTGWETERERESESRIDWDIVAGRQAADRLRYN